jgi:diguanylate cyclase (GGDEF)-like protein
MRLRWIIVLCALALKLCLVGALLLVGRSVLQKNYAVLEREHVHADLAHLCLILQAQLKELDNTALDYAAWDATYDFMRHRRAEYGTANLESTSFRARGITLYVLINESGRLVLAKAFDGDTGETLNADVAQLVRAVNRRSVRNPRVAGLLTLTQGPALVAMRPILPTNATGKSRGTLVMVRELGQKQIAEISRLADFPIAISGISGEAAEVFGTGQLQVSQDEITVFDRNRIRGVAMVNDIWKQPRIRVQIDHARGIWHQGEQVLRALLLMLLVVGLLFAFLSVWLIQKFVVRRVERLIRLIRRTEGAEGLSARIRMRGSDELAQLGDHLNEMLQRLQNSQEKIAAAQERLRYEATHDSLTGLWNRSAALRLLDGELDRADREHKSTAVIMFDADHFKRVNDHFGHTAGDRALQSVASAITRNLRSFDVCCRYGGEEFLVIAPNCTLEQGEQLARRILDYCSSTPVILPEQAFCVTLSAGVSATAFRCTGEDLIIVADRALYRAKENGRNRLEQEQLVPNQPVRSARFAHDLDRAM